MDAVLAKTDPWKCGICSSLFESRAVLRRHILTDHKIEDNQVLKICKRCPYTNEASYVVKMHEKSHSKNDVKFKDKADGRECKLCHVWFGTNGFLVAHLYKYHLPKDPPNDPQ